MQYKYSCITGSCQTVNIQDIYVQKTNAEDSQTDRVVVETGESNMYWHTVYNNYAWEERLVEN